MANGALGGIGEDDNELGGRSVGTLLERGKYSIGCPARVQVAGAVDENFAGPRC